MAETSDHYILFSVAGTTYALPSQEVAHVEMVEQITRVPNAAAFVDGVVFSRGQVVPAVNRDLRTRLLIVQAAGRTVGLLVDACREFLTIPPTAIQPPGEGLTGVGTRYISGIATLNDRLIVILNLGALLDSAEPILAA
jgi:purine-binding chemotaxis protein CheW